MIFQPEYLAAFAIGFLGSLHCLGMCGPIALVVPSLGKGTIGRLTGGLFYNLGRIITYSILGYLAGLAGKGFALFQWQQGLSITLGTFIILYNAFPYWFREAGNILSKAFGFSWLKSSLSNSLNRKSFGGVISIGLLNGLLPCGLVYMGLAGSIDTASEVSGALFMAFFGLGTLPMMSGLHLIGHNLKGNLGVRMSRIIPVFAISLGIFFIIRGMGLGIPYISPSMDPHSGDIQCTSPAHRH